MIGEPLEVWHATLAALPVKVLTFEWDEARGLPYKIILDIPRKRLAATVRPRTPRRTGPIRIMLHGFGVGFGNRLFMVKEVLPDDGGYFHLFMTGALYNVVRGAAAKRLDAETGTPRAATKRLDAETDTP